MSFTDELLKALINGNLWKRFVRKIKNGMRGINGRVAKFILNKRTSVVPNRIIFTTSRGSFNCNCKAIVQEIIKRDLPYDLIWVARKENMASGDFPTELTLVQRGSYEYFCAAMSSKVWFDNSVSMAWVGTPKKKEQILFQTWHGSMGIKRVDSTTDKRWKKTMQKYGTITDYCISNSAFEDDVYCDNYWGGVPILKYGHPRNDILFPNHQIEQHKLSEAIRKRYNIPNETKLLLYAPTYRKEHNYRYFDIDYERLSSVLETRFGGDWCILTRFHFMLRNYMKQHVRLPENVIDVTEYDDIQDLMAVADAGITDYSSWICDFALTARPGFLFTVDLKQYDQKRGFYYPLDTLPFPIAQNNDDLINNILNFDADVFEEKRVAYLNKMGSVENGHAAERVVDKLETIINT